MVETITYKRIWTFTRSTKLLAGKGLLASWKHRNVHFQVWEPEADLSVDPIDDDFFKTDEGAPRVLTYPNQPVTSYPATIDWIASKKPTFQVPHVIFRDQRYGWTCEVTSQLVGDPLSTALLGIVKTDEEDYLYELPPDAAPMVQAKQLCASLAVQVADAIMESEDCKFTHYDRAKIAMVCERAQLSQRAWARATDRADVNG